MMFRFSIAVVVACHAFAFSNLFVSQSAVKTSPEKAVRELLDACDRFRDPKDALMLIREFRHKTELRDPLAGQVANAEAEWQSRLENNLVRLGPKWVTAAEKAAADKESKKLVDEALALVRVNDFDGARGVLEKASNVNKEDGLADFLLGLHYAMNHQPEEGKKHFKKVLARSPANVGAMNNLAVCELKDGNGSLALKHWTDAAAIAPDSPELIHNLGRVIYEQQQKRLRISKPIFEKFRKLYASIAASTDQRNAGTSAWMLTPAIAGADVKPEKKEGENANLVSLGRGTGFFISQNLILTNRHVVESDTFGRADAVQISVPSGQDKTSAVRAEIVAVSTDHDLALLKCDDLSLPPLSLSDNVPPLGTEVMALGYPRTDLLGLTIKSTRGSISGVSDGADGILFYDVAINPGNSGGPLMDKSGKVVSINTFYVKLEQEISGGVSGTKAIEFVKTHIPGFTGNQNPVHANDWPDVAAVGSKSTVLVEVLYADAAPVLAAKAGGEQLSGAFFLDRACLICRGTGRTSCPNRACIGGKIRVQYTERRMIGVRGYEQPYDVPLWRHEDCPHCAQNAVICPDCKGNGKARP